MIAKGLSGRNDVAAAMVMVVMMMRTTTIEMMFVDLWRRISCIHFQAQGNLMSSSSMQYLREIILDPISQILTKTMSVGPLKWIIIPV